MLRPHPGPRLFPYTTLFRSSEQLVDLELRSELAGRWRMATTSIMFSAIPDRKSTRLNSSHVAISYAVFCLKKKRLATDLAEKEGMSQEKVNEIHTELKKEMT